VLRLGDDNKQPVLEPLGLHLFAVVAARHSERDVERARRVVVVRVPDAMAKPGQNGAGVRCNLH
jgi:hypothetical protein